MKRRVFSSLSLVLTSLFLLSACQKGETLTEANLVTADSVADGRKIGSAQTPFSVLSSSDAKKDVASGKILLASSEKGGRLLKALVDPTPADPALATTPAPAPAAPAVEPDRANSLVLGFPIGLLGEAQVFGGVITKASKGDSETIGRLKLIDLTPLHIRPVVATALDGSYSLALIGCAQACTETSVPSRLQDIPIVGINQADSTLILDLATLGDDLNLVQMMDPKGDYLKMKTKTSQVVLFDYSVSTLVFDVEVTMIPLDAAALQDEVKFTARWYLRLGSVFHSEFLSRPAVPGVGFFMTERTATPKIQRHNLTQLIPGQAPVKYYIKNVPVEYQASFAKAFDNWNEVLKKEVGTALLRYEFVDATDPRAKLLIAGDPRYNIVEWDLDNLAPYGGLGPSIANQFTGEMLTSNILVQGPHIVELYTNWFKVGEVARNLKARGMDEEASTLLRDYARSVDKDMKRLASAGKVEMSLGNLKLRVPSQMPELEDPLFARDDFELLPPNMKYEEYMSGYWAELVGHEMGHNLGLRHNFRGNLSAEAVKTPGKVSGSIMEYLGRGFRYLDTVGPYDVMALAYGYHGKTPTVLTTFCTDEDVADLKTKGNSPECSRDDATPDPFGFFESRLARAVSLLTNPGKTVASTWTLADLEGPLGISVGGMGLYAASASVTGAKWTNFFNGGDRPWFTSGVKPYVIKKIKAQLCDAKLGDAIAEKASLEDRSKTASLVGALRAKVASLLTGAGITAADLTCVSR